LALAEREKSRIANAGKPRPEGRERLSNAKQTMKSKLNPFVAASLAAFAAFIGTAAADQTKADNTSLLDLAASWSGTAPTLADIAIWDGIYNTAGSLSAAFTASTPVSWMGIKVGSLSGTAAGLVSVGGTGSAITGSQITIGSSGIAMSTANQNLVINAATTVLTGATQTWDIGSGRNLRFGTTGTGSGNANLDGAGGTAITVQGGGVVDANQGGALLFADAAGFAGFNGKWTIASGTTLRGIRNGATAWGTNTAADAITLSGGTLAVGGISGSQGNWTWETPVTLTAATDSNIDQQIFTGSGRSLILRGAMTGSGNLTFRETGTNDSFTNNDLGYIVASDNPGLSGTITIGGATENGITGRFSSVRVGGDGAAGSVATGVGSSGSLGTATIVNNGVLTLSRNNAWTFANDISGTGLLRIGVTTGSATHIVTVSGNNTHSGGTTLQSAVTLKIGSPNALGTGTFTIAGNGIFDNATGVALTTANALTMSGGSPTFTGTNDMTINGAVLISGANRTITVSANTLTLGGNIGQDVAGRGLTKGGPGTLALTGLLNTFTGNVTVSNGVLDLKAGKLYTSGYNNTAVVAVNGGTLKMGSFAYDAVDGLGQLADYGARRVINGGTLEVTGAAHSSGNNFNVGSNGGIFRYNPVNTAETLTLAGNGNSNISITGALTLQADGNIAVGEAIESTGSLTKTGNGMLTLGGISTYTGTTTVSAGSLLVSGALGATEVTVGASGALGGDGVIGGSLHFDAGADFLFDPFATLTVNGPNVNFGGFGVADLVGLNGSVADGTYTLIDGTAAFDFANVANFGLANAYSLDGGKAAYLESGSLRLVVIPEPGVILLSSLGLLLLCRRSRP
jgi:autotransporter-associated beta strand protein